MALLGIDLGGTKAAVAVFSNDGAMIVGEKIMLNGRQGAEVGALITERINFYKNSTLPDNATIETVGVSVPGIYFRESGKVWAPNIPGWEAYPLMDEIKSTNPQIPATIDSDRVCYILGECWQGNTKGCTDAIYLSVGTGIGAGILSGGKVLRGANGIAGAIGWMALATPYNKDDTFSGCLENHASGAGMARYAERLVKESTYYEGELKDKAGSINSFNVLAAFENKDLIAMQVIEQCIECWGMAVANLVSLFDPEKIILGGGLFGPAVTFLPQIKDAASKWAQPVSAGRYSLESSALGNNAGVYGAAFLALQHIHPENLKNGHV